MKLLYINQVQFVCVDTHENLHQRSILLYKTIYLFYKTENLFYFIKQFFVYFYQNRANFVD